VRGWFCAFLALTVASAAAAELLPQPGRGDPRLQSVRYDPEQVVRLAFAPGIALTIQLSHDERIENVAIGASEGWQVTANRRGDLLFVKQLANAAETNLTVVTDARRYSFVLAPDAASGFAVAHVLRFDYPGVTTAPEVTVLPARGTYRLGGARALRPVDIHDDGQATYVAWSPELSLPAIYTVDAAGRESIVNGAMRDGVFVIDAVAPRLVFRSGRLRATATRRVERRPG
jgi:type IV secretion system protein VirB9